MNYNDYSYLYRYTCKVCQIGIELRSKEAIPLGSDPKCLCNNSMIIDSYFGLTGYPMYKNETIKQ